MITDKYKKDIDALRENMAKKENEWKSKEENYKKNEEEWKVKYKKAAADILEERKEFEKKVEEWKLKEKFYTETQQSYKQWWTNIVTDVTEIRKLGEKMMAYPSPSGKISEKLTMKNKVKIEQGTSHRPAASYTPPIARASISHPFTRSTSINKEPLRPTRVDSRRK